MKADVFAWLDKNPPGYRKKAAAAREIAGNVVPMTPQTIDRWITQWEKVRSSSKI